MAGGHAMSRGHRRSGDRPLQAGDDGVHQVGELLLLAFCADEGVPLLANGIVILPELALEVPAFVLCRDDCAGLCPTCGADLNAGPCACVRSAEPA